jgi:hypothetical protein
MIGLVGRILLAGLIAERGVEKRVELDGLSSADVEKKIGELLSSSA